jgi:two-component system CheB/CheR fusion protein
MDEASGSRRGFAFDLGPIAQVVVDAKGILRQANEHARAILGLRSEDVGEPFVNLAASRRSVDLPALLDRARRSGRGDVIRGVPATTADGREMVVDVQVISLATDGELLGTVVTFTDVTELGLLRRSVERSAHDLQAALAELRLTGAHLERLGEELRSSDAELKLMSDELRSSTEELEISNEEVRSGNEELRSTTDELDLRTRELGAATRLMDSMIDALGAAFILDEDLTIRLWSRECEALWGVHDGAVNGRRLQEVEVGLPIRPLEALARAVLADGEPAELVIDAQDRDRVSVPFRVAASLLGGAGDVPEGVLVVVRREPAVG